MPKRRGTVLVSKRRKIDEDRSDLPIRAIKGAGSASALDSPPQILDNMIRILRENKHMLISDLTGQAKTTYDTFVLMIQSLRGHTNYATIYDTIQRHFKDEGRGRPGTVLAYLTGCMYNRNSNEQVGCSYACQNGLQPPGSFNYKCREKVIVCIVSNDRYEFTVHQDSPSNRAIVYVPDIAVAEDFVGFSKDEISKLQELGVRFVLVRGIPPGSIDYIEITIGYVMITGISTRGNVTIINEENDSSGVMVAILVILSIILFLMMVVAIWYIFMSQRGIGKLPSVTTAIL